MTYPDPEIDALYDLLSDRQKAILTYIEEAIEADGFPPTIREIGKACDINSTSVVNYNLKKLVEGGWLERSKEKSRGIRVLRPRKQAGDAQPVAMRLAEAFNVARVALRGAIVAGEPLASFDDQPFDPDLDTVEVSRDMLRGLDESEVFALRVKGESMIDALIDDGDIVILRRQQTCKNGDMVAVWLPESEETTLKAFYDEGSQIRLQPRNPTMDPIIVHPNNCQVQGMVLGVIRTL